MSFLCSISISSGNSEHPGDILNNAEVCLLQDGKEAKSENFVNIGKFNHGNFHYVFVKNNKFGKISVVKINVLQNSTSWIIFREVY